MLPVIALSQFAGASMGFAVNAVMPDLQQACETTGSFIAISRYLQACTLRTLSFTSDALEIFANACQASVGAEVVREFFDNEVGHALVHLQGEQYMRTKSLISIGKYDFMTGKSRCRTLANARKVYAERAKSTGDAIKFMQPQGGLFFWTRLTGKSGKIKDAGEFVDEPRRWPFNCFGLIRMQNNHTFQQSQAPNPKALENRYSRLVEVKAALGDKSILLGSKGRCRYCGTTDKLQFREIAHTFPAAIGNKWIFSRDECDQCNKIFSLYDEAFANSVCPLLTIGGTLGRDNAIRQTGRSNGAAVLKRTKRQGEKISEIQAFAKNADLKESGPIVGEDGLLRLSIPVSDVRFKPRLAYKALSKMALALLPNDELDHYQKLKAWILNPDEDIDFPNLEVALSFGSIGNAPALVVGTLLRRNVPTDTVPHILFLLCAGSVCVQIALMSDHEEDHLPPTLPRAISIDWTVVIARENGLEPIHIEYGKPTQFNWSSKESVPQPVDAFLLSFDQTTTQATFTPVFRAGYDSI